MSIDWQDQGLVLQVKPFGERDALVQLLTSQHGRHAGMVRAAQSREKRALLQLGNQLSCRWQARLNDQLGNWTIEPLALHAGALLNRKLPLLAAVSACELVLAATAEREPVPIIFAALMKLVEALANDPEWAEIYVRFEIVLLAQSGFALDLSKCAVTGQTHDLTFVSPRTGRAVSTESAGPYVDRLLPLPPFLTGTDACNRKSLADGIRLTGHFMSRSLFDDMNKPLPPARAHLATLLAEDAKE